MNQKLTQCPKFLKWFLIRRRDLIQDLLEWPAINKKSDVNHKLPVLIKVTWMKLYKSKWLKNYFLNWIILSQIKIRKLKINMTNRKVTEASLKHAINPLSFHIHLLKNNRLIRYSYRMIPIRMNLQQKKGLKYWKIGRNMYSPLSRLMCLKVWVIWRSRQLINRLKIYSLIIDNTLFSLFHLPLCYRIYLYTLLFCL